MSFWLGSGVLQIKPNLVWSIIRVGRRWYKKKLCYSLLLKKAIFLYGNLRVPQITNFKNRSFASEQELSKSNSTPYGVLAVYLKSKTKKICYRLPGEKVSFSYGELPIFQKSDCKNKSFWLGPGVLQIKPNLVWCIVRVGGLWDKKKFCNRLPLKKICFQYENLQILRITNFKIRSFPSNQWVVQIKPHSVWSIDCVPNF